MRFEWKGFITVEANDEAAAREVVDDALTAINKNPDGPRVYLDDGPPFIDEEV